MTPKTPAEEQGTMRVARSAFPRPVLRSVYAGTISALIVQQRLLDIDPLFTCYATPWDSTFKDVFEQVIVESINNVFPLKGLFL